METIEKKGERVRLSSSGSRNEKIDREIISNISRYANYGDDGIAARIRKLDKKWDIERTLELNAGLLGLAGSVLALTMNKRWAILPAVVTTFLIQHAVQGWCPPLPVFRSLGIKTRRELDREKFALKALRGDFSNADNARQAWRAVNE